MKKYKLYFNETITEVEVERETEAFVIINGRREGKNVAWCSFHDTYEDAYQTGINNHMKKIEEHQHNLKYCVDAFNDFMSKYNNEMTKP
jgi:hypothetical protein